jgi:hypothetical protein
MSKEELLTKFAALLKGMPQGSVVLALLAARLEAAAHTSRIAACKRTLALTEAEALLGAEGKSKEVREAEAEVALSANQDYQAMLGQLDQHQTMLATAEAEAEAARAVLRLVEAQAGALADKEQITQLVGVAS